MQEVTALWTVALPAWQWIVGIVIALWLWETVVENWFYRAKHWVFNKKHTKTISRRR